MSSHCHRQIQHALFISVMLKWWAKMRYEAVSHLYDIRVPISAFNLICERRVPSLGKVIVHFHGLNVKSFSMLTVEVAH